jgi:hypothetical protein
MKNKLWIKALIIVGALNLFAASALAVDCPAVSNANAPAPVVAPPPNPGPSGAPVVAPT